MLRHIVVAAALLAPLSTAHAEFISTAQPEVRPRMPKLVSEPLTVDTMLAKINSSYMTGLRRCYNKGLAQDPTLGGRVVVTFTVNPYGRVSGQAVGIDTKVDACLSGAISSWRFATPTSRKEATFRISLLLSK